MFVRLTTIDRISICILYILRAYGNTLIYVHSFLFSKCPQSFDINVRYFMTHTIRILYCSNFFTCFNWFTFLHLRASFDLFLTVMVIPFVCIIYCIAYFCTSFIIAHHSKMVSYITIDALEFPPKTR